MSWALWLLLGAIAFLVLGFVLALVVGQYFEHYDR